MSTRRSCSSLALGFILLAGLTAWAPRTASSQTAPPKLKALEQRLLLEEAQGRLDYYLARAAGKTASPGERPMLARDADEPGGPQGGSLPSAAPWMSSSYTNVLVNNRATDTGPGSGQSEVSIAAFGGNVVAAWNDGEGFAVGGSTQGYAYSSNGGLTWVDGGSPPTTNVGTWTSDPQVVVNEKTGAFYFAALCETGTTNGIGVVKGTFSGGVLTWGTPRLVISANNTFAIYDKEWLAADSTTGNLYLIYSRYTVTGGAITTNRIDFQRNTGDNAIAWDAPVTLSSPSDAGLVQGARVAVGPGGDVWTVWNAIGLTDADFMRVRRSSVGGTSFAPQVTAASEFTNYGSGAPGFNRGMGFTFPALAVDRTNGPHRGRAYLAWNESLNFFNDNLGTSGIVAELEPNDSPFTGTPFTMGKHLTGTISTGTDFDYWQFNGTAGQTIICLVDATSAPTLDASFRLFCTDGSTRLAFAETGTGGSGLIVFTLPASGTYTLRVAAFSSTGAYVIDTGLNGPVVERARDHRDLFVNYSSDFGTTWSTPARVNDDPGTLDNWLPEIAVADVGRPYVIWYDWRDAPAGTCGGVSHVYLSRSDDGGSSWISMGPITDVQTAWTSVSSNIAPNQGDYLGLFGNAIELHAGWADGRNGDPDVYTAAVPLVAVPVQISVAATDVEPDRVRVTWYAADGGALVATVYRRTGAGEWEDLGRISTDGTGEMVFEDRSVQPGTRYYYRLGVLEGTRESFLGDVTVDVPAAPGLAIEAVRPNPADRELWVTFSLPGPASATLELLDVSGRRIRAQTVSGAGRQTVDLAAGGRLAPGVYLVWLLQDGHSVVVRASVVR
jgi:hypothetical protein